MDKKNTLQEKFETIYNAETDAIFRFCLVRVSNREQALDITQETFTRLWQSLIQGAQITNQRSFLFTIAHRLVIDWYRKKKNISLESLAKEDEGEDYEPVNERAAEDLKLEAEGRYLIAKICELSPSHRQAVYLRFVEGLPPGEIGEALGISANAASVRVSRGIEELRSLTGYNIDPNN